MMTEFVARDKYELFGSGLITDMNQAVALRMYE
jgi:hypothetical protein